MMQKFFKHEFLVNILLNFLRQLFKNALIIIFFERHVFIGPPFVIEKGLYLLFEGVVERLLVVEVLHGSEELRQAISIFQFFIEFLILIKDADEVAHDVRENSDSEKQDEGTEQPFNIAPGMIITKTHGRQRCKGKICHYNRVFAHGLAVKRVMVNKGLWKLLSSFFRVPIHIKNEIIH